MTTPGFGSQPEEVDRMLATLKPYFDEVAQEVLRRHAATPFDRFESTCISFAYEALKTADPRDAQKLMAQWQAFSPNIERENVSERAVELWGLADALSLGLYAPL